MNLIKGLLFGIVATSILEAIFYLIPYLKVNFWDNPRLFFGYHFHHSIIGLLIISYSLIIPQKKQRGLFLIGLGLGLIIIHTLIDGRLVFIE